MKIPLWLLLLLLPAAAAFADDHPCKLNPKGPWAFDGTVMYFNMLKFVSEEAKQTLPDQAQIDPGELNAQCPALKPEVKQQACGVLVDWGTIKKFGIRSNAAGQWQALHKLDDNLVPAALKDKDVQQAMEQVCSAYADRESQAKKLRTTQGQAQNVPMDRDAAIAHVHAVLDTICADKSLGGCPSSPAPKNIPVATPQSAAASNGFFCPADACVGDKANDCTCLCTQYHSRCDSYPGGNVCCSNATNAAATCIGGNQCN
jgi:hypothetical protein